MSRHAFATLLSLKKFLPVKAKKTPGAAKLFAIAAPMPLDAPVISTDLNLFIERLYTMYSCFNRNEAVERLVFAFRELEVI